MSLKYAFPIPNAIKVKLDQILKHQKTMPPIFDVSTMEKRNKEINNEIEVFSTLIMSINETKIEDI